MTEVVDELDKAVERHRAEVLRLLCTCTQLWLSDQRQGDHIPPTNGQEVLQPSLTVDAREQDEPNASPLPDACEQIDEVTATSAADAGDASLSGSSWVVSRIQWQVCSH